MRSALLLAVLAAAACKSGSHAPEPSAGKAPAPPAQLAVGSPAPDFSLPGSDGKTYRLSDSRGKKPVVIAWYPKAFTGG
jgi:peroxiredoxin Q/BCP